MAHRARRSWHTPLAVLSLVALARTAHAADPAPAEPAAPALEAPASESAAKRHLVGVRGRYLVLPKFILSPFVDGGESLSGSAFGLEYGTQKSGFETVVALSYAGLAGGPTPFKAKGDPDEAYEIVKLDLHVLFATVDFLWSNEVAPKFRVLYGASAGLGLVWGSFTRHQAQPLNGQPGDPYTYVPCPANADGTASGLPAPTRYCFDDNDRYGREEKSWFGGGSKPVFLPWLALQTGARYDLTNELVARLDLGFGVTGAFVGLGAQYQLP